MWELHTNVYGQKGFANGVAIDSVDRFHCAGVHVAWGSSHSDHTAHPSSHSQCRTRFAEDGSAIPDNSLATESASIATTTHKFWKLDPSRYAKRAKTRANSKSNKIQTKKMMMMERNRSVQVHGKIGKYKLC